RLEEFRPHASKAEEDTLLRATLIEPGKGPLTKDRYKVKTDELQDMLAKRVDETLAPPDVHASKRPDIEKRQCGAVPLLNLGLFKRADNNPLYPQGRAEVVCGIRDYTRAADMAALVLERLEKRALEAIHRDRGEIVYALDYRVHDPKLFAEKVTM